MVSSWITSSKLVLRVALLVLLTGCSNVTGSKAPQPVNASPSSDAAPVALAGLQLGYIWQSGQHNLYPILGVTGATHYGGARPLRGREHGQCRRHNVAHFLIDSRSQ